MKDVFLDALVDIHVARLDGRIDRSSNLAVVEDHPLLLLLANVAHIVTTGGRGAHVADNGKQPILCKNRMNTCVRNNRKGKQAFVRTAASRRD
jgi:hypothetical protein